MSAARTARATAAFALALASLGASEPRAATAAGATAAASATEIALGVTFTPRDTGRLDRALIVGELDLHLMPDGKIVGFYRPESDRTPIPLTGARTPDRTFFDVGSGMRDFHVEGRLQDANGAASGLDGTARIGDEQYDVAAAPCRDARGTLSILCQ